MEIGLNLETGGCHGNQVGLTALAEIVYMYQYLCKKGFHLGAKEEIRQISATDCSHIINKIGSKLNPVYSTPLAFTRIKARS